MITKEIPNLFLQQAATILKEQNGLISMPETTEAVQQLLYDLQVENLALQLKYEAEKKENIFNQNQIEQAFQSIAEQSFEPISIANFDGNYVFVNNAFCQLTGYSQEELLKMKVFDLKYDSDTPPVFEQMKIKGIGMDEVHLKRKDGSFFLATIRGKVIHIGKEKLAFGIINDISEQRNKELLHAASKETFELAINGSSAGVWDWKNINEDEEWWSPQFYYMLGYTPEELPARHSNFKKILHPAHFEAVFDLVQKHFEHGTPFDIEIQLLTKSGEYKWFRDTAISQRNENGKPIRMVGSIVSIHDRKVAEEQNNYHKYLLEKSQEIAHIGTWELDIVNGHLAWTDESYRIFGVPLGTPLTYEIFLHQIYPDDRNYVNEEWTKAVVEKTPYDIEHRLLLDGQVKWVREKATIYYDNEGQAINAIGFTQDITTFKTIKEELQHTKETLELALKAANAAVIVREIIDIEKVWWSPNLYKLLGYQNNEIYPSLEFFSKTIHPKDQLLAYQAIQPLSPSEKTVNFNIEYRLKNKEGNYRWFKSRGFMEYNHEGIPIRTISTIIDIHDEKNNELLIKKQQKILEQTQEMGNIGGGEFDLVHQTMAWSKESYQIFEVAPETPITYELFLEKVHPDDRNFVNEQWMTAVAQKTPYDTTYRLLLDKKIKWVRQVATIYHDENGTATNAVGFTQDITKFKVIEAKLQENQEYLRKGAEIAQLGFWKYIPATKSIEYSPEFIKIYELEDVSVSNVMNTVHPDDLLLCRHHIGDGMKNGISWDIQHRLLFPNGRIKWLRGKGEPILDKDGNTLSMVGTIQDITKEKTLEVALLQAKTESDKNAKIKEIFLANMSHEIRTPMNGVLGFSRLLLETHLDNTQRGYAESIYGSAENLLVIINDILDISKIESGKMDIRTTAFDLLHKIETTLKIFHVSIKEKGLYLHVHLDKNVPSCVIAAPDRIAQILINLVGNAIKFTEKGGVDLYVSIKDKEQLFFEIKDTGIGIPQEKLENIFEAFTQVENYRTREHGGTGLGLTISKQLVELMGGTIGVKSELHKGSTFYFSLPLTPCETTMDKSSDQKNILKKFQNVHILVAEDHPINQKLALVYLERLGCSHELVVNGEEAVIRASEQRFDAILMDIQMPKMDGIEATRRIRKTDKNIPIIAMTAHALEKEKQHCFDIGMNDYLSKPFKLEELDAVLSKYISEEKPLAFANTTANIVDVSEFYAALKTMEDDKELLMDLLEILQVELVKFTDEVGMAIQEFDLNKIIEIQHKMKPSFEIFKLSNQATLLRTIRKLLEEKASSVILNEYFQELEKSIPPLIKTIQKLKIEN